MTLKLWVATTGALLSLPVFVFAQQSRQLPDPADPRIAVPAVAYHSAFAGASVAPPQENAPTPDKVWKSANATVAAAPSHAGHGGSAAPADSDGHAGHGAPAPAAKPAVQPAVDHSKHH